MEPWCSLVNTLACQASDRGFKSRRLRHLKSEVRSRESVVKKMSQGSFRLGNLSRYDATPFMDTGGDSEPEGERPQGTESPRNARSARRDSSGGRAQD